MLSTKQISNMYVLAFFKTFVPTFLPTLLVFGYIDTICMKLGILTFEGDEDLNVKASIEDTVKSSLLKDTAEKDSPKSSPKNTTVQE